MKYLTGLGLLIVGACLLAIANAAALPEASIDDTAPIPEDISDANEEASKNIQEFLQELAAKNYNEFKPAERSLGLLLPILFPNSFFFGG